jgi:hypothetical protein
MNLTKHETRVVHAYFSVLLRGVEVHPKQGIKFHSAVRDCNPPFARFVCCSEAERTPLFSELQMYSQAREDVRVGWGRVYFNSERVSHLFF